MNDAQIEAIADQRFEDGKAEGIIEEHARGEERLATYRERNRSKMIGAGLAVVLFGGAALHFTYESGRNDERQNPRPDPIKTPANPDNGEGIPYAPPRVWHVPSVIADPSVMPIEIPVGDVRGHEDDGLAPID